MEYLPEENSRYKDIDYWDERYKTEQCYDWLGSFSKFQHILEKHVLKEDSILILGCGNSSMSGDMYNAGYHGITNIDYSSVCIGTMSDRYSDCVGMTWHQMDVRRLSFPDASFDVIIEKATLDAIMVEEKTPWEVSPQADGFIHQALTEWLPGAADPLNRLDCVTGLLELPLSCSPPPQSRGRPLQQSDTLAYFPSFSAFLPLRCC
ncbi:EEF1A lysine methyltransferase 4 isoform X3 [Gasterosteus aculeatus]